jgi:amino acid transporter
MPSDKKDDESLRKTGSNKFGEVSAGVVMDEVSHAGGLHRVLGNRQIQLLSAGGAIGTGLFISIGAALAKGGPASLFIAFSLFSSVLTCINNSMAEMTTHMPVAGGFVRLAGYWVDDALAGCNSSSLRHWPSRSRLRL